MIDSAPILLAEDDENDLFFMQMAIKKAGIPNPLLVVRNGEEAVHYLESARILAQGEEHSCPALVLLDINMPILNGFQVLQWLQTRRFPQPLVVVMLTSSSNPSDQARAMALGAVDYLVKPCNATQLVPMLRELQGRWLTERSSTGTNGRTATLVSNSDIE